MGWVDVDTLLERQGAKPSKRAAVTIRVSKPGRQRPRPHTAAADLAK